MNKVIITVIARNQDEALDRMARLCIESKEIGMTELTNLLSGTTEDGRVEMRKEFTW